MSHDPDDETEDLKKRIENQVRNDMVDWEKSRVDRTLKYLSDTRQLASAFAATLKELRDQAERAGFSRQEAMSLCLEFVRTRGIIAY